MMESDEFREEKKRGTHTGQRSTQFNIETMVRDMNMERGILTRWGSSS